MGRRVLRSRTKRPRRRREVFEAVRNGRADGREFSKPYEMAAPTAGSFRSRTKWPRRRQGVFEAVRNDRADGREFSKPYETAAPWFS